MKIKISLILGIIAGLVIIVTGVLTALKITPGITAVGSEVLLGIWRVFAGILILTFAMMAKKFPLGNILVLLLGTFEVFVFFVEKDYTILTTGPFIAILAGIFGVLKR